MTVNSYLPESFTHPGSVLHEKLGEINMSIKEFALRAGKPEKTIHEIINSESSITSDMAVLFEKVLKIPAKFWLNYQSNYNESVSRVEFENMLAKNVSWSGLFPYNEMANKGWINKTRNLKERVENLLRFFGFSSPKAWERYYFNCELRTSFRISLKHIKEPYAISAWLRKGEIEAVKLQVNEFKETHFKKNLESFRSIIIDNPDNLFEQLRTKCSEYGVKLLYVPYLPKAPISGCTRWINDSPVIQISGRYKKNDRFWFTFLHEAGHILLHGKKDVFLEGIEDNQVQEQEADEFASDYLISKQNEKELLAAGTITDNMIKEFAFKLKIHPAIIAGRLQHLYNDYTIGNTFMSDVKFVD